jgi:hypothetical protein
LYATLDLPLDNFIRCICDKELSALIISGRPSQEQLLRSWEVIFTQFLDGMKDDKGLRKLRLTKEINRLGFDYKIIELSLTYLDVAYDPEIAATLSRHIRVDKLDPEDRPTYERALKVVHNRAQRLKLELDEKRAEMAVLDKLSTGKSVTITRHYFDQLIGQVARYMHFYINRRKTTTGEFVSFYSLMKEESEAIKQKTAQRRR